MKLKHWLSRFHFNVETRIWFNVLFKGNIVSVQHTIKSEHIVSIWLFISLFFSIVHHVLVRCKTYPAFLWQVWHTVRLTHTFIFYFFKCLISLVMSWSNRLDNRVVMTRVLVFNDWDSTGVTYINASTPETWVTNFIDLTWTRVNNLIDLTRICSIWPKSKFLRTVFFFTMRCLFNCYMFYYEARRSMRQA